MRKALRLQGLLFVAVGALATWASFGLRQGNAFLAIGILAGLILLFGVPHGALDTLYAQKIYGVKGTGGWLRFGSAYLAPVALVVWLWQAMPLLFLLGFLLISAIHFSGDPEAGTPVMARAFYGGGIIVLPLLLHGVEVRELFSMLVGPDAAGQVVAGLQVLSWPWLAGLSVSALWLTRKNWVGALEVAALGSIAVLAPPLWAFTIFFCAMHSARHILRSYVLVGESSARLMLLASVLPMLAVGLLGAAVLYFREGISLEARLVQLIFAGLAALTVPHMALVERLRFAANDSEC